MYHQFEQALQLKQFDIERSIRRKNRESFLAAKQSLSKYVERCIKPSALTDDVAAQFYQRAQTLLSIEFPEE